MQKNKNKSSTITKDKDIYRKELRYSEIQSFINTIEYKKICKEHKCKAKVFTQMPAKLSSQIGSPDLIILFTNTVSHKMVKCAVAEAERSKAEVVRSHSSSGNALNEILEKVC